VDISGAVLESWGDCVPDDALLLKRTILAQALPNGHCHLPVQAGPCPHANACLTCIHFRSSERFLPILKQQLAETERILQWAQDNRAARQLEMNERVRKNLANMITALEGGAATAATRATLVSPQHRAPRRRPRSPCPAQRCDSGMAGTHPRNVAGMVQHAEARRSGARQREENAIRMLVESGQEVNFLRISELGRVSSAFLYREVDLAERIRQLRVQGEPRPAYRNTERASDASKDAIIKTLRVRIAELEQTRRELTDKNQQLQKQLEVLYGELYGQRSRAHTDRP
jgi:hypothetical protein